MDKLTNSHRVVIILDDGLVAEISRWRKSQPGAPPSRADAVRQLLRLALRVVDN